MKKANKRKWMILLIILTILIIPLNKAKANTYSYEYNPNDFYYQRNGSTSWTRTTITRPNINGMEYNFITLNGQEINAILYERGLPTDKSGTLEFNIIYTGELNNVPNIIGQTYGNEFICYPSSTPTYNGSNTYNINYKCPNYQPREGYNQILIQINQPSGKVMYNFGISRVITITTNGSEEITNSINQQTTELHQQWLQDATNWSTFENTDISNNAKQQPNQQNYDSVQTFEDGIFSELDDPNILALIDIGIDTDTNTWIWNTITGIFNANVRVMTMVISVLTLGLAKFLMGR